jgi:hypothetical protein
MEIVMYIGCMAQQTTQKENRETLGGRLARLRKEQGLTQIELVLILTLNAQHLSEYLTSDIRIFCRRPPRACVA